jgi:hypothetical protein
MSNTGNEKPEFPAERNTPSPVDELGLSAGGCDSMSQIAGRASQRFRWDPHFVSSRRSRADHLFFLITLAPAVLLGSALYSKLASAKPPAAGLSGAS